MTVVPPSLSNTATGQSNRSYKVDAISGAPPPASAILVNS